jgi:hypothetical protein
MGGKEEKSAIKQFNDFVKEETAMLKRVFIRLVDSRPGQMSQ